MGLKQILLTVHSILEQASIEHALIGGLGLAALGIHRATHDVDFLVLGTDRDRLKATMQNAGWRMQLETGEVIHFSGVGNVDFLLARRSHSENMLRQAALGKFHGIRHVSPEALIGLKIQAYKNDKKRELQDKADIAAIIRKYPNLNWELVKTYADLFSEWEVIQSLRNAL